MSKRSRQQLLLALLGVVLAIVVWRQLAPGLSGRAGTPVGTSPAATRTVERDLRTGSLPQVEELRLDDLRAVETDFGGGRNPFQIDRPPPPSPSAAEIRQAKQQDEASRPEPEVPAQPVRPTPPPVDVVFLGSFGPDNGRLAVFTDGREIYNVGQGEVLKDKYVVVRIGFESADLGFIGFPGAPTRRLEIGG